MTAATLLDLLPPFATGDKIRWTAAAQASGFTDRTFTVVDVADLGDRWRVHAEGSKDDRYITVTWPKAERPRIEVMATFDAPTSARRREAAA